MKKRQFLSTAALAGLGSVILPEAHAAASKSSAGPALLTVTGAIGKSNRGRFDPVRDQMMYKQKISFEQAHAFDFAALSALPKITIKPTLAHGGAKNWSSAFLPAAYQGTALGHAGIRAKDLAEPIENLMSNVTPEIQAVASPVAASSAAIRTRRCPPMPVKSPPA